MAKVFYYGKDGEVIKTETKRQGKPSKGMVRDDEGNFHVRFEPEKPKPEYVTITEDGQVSREPKGRGKTRKGYEFQDDGEYAGHYLKDMRKPADVTAD